MWGLNLGLRSFRGFLQVAALHEPLSTDRATCRYSPAAISPATSSPDPGAEAPGEHTAY